MATLEDKILGEKLEYYCSSSDEDEEIGMEKEGTTSNTTNPTPSTVGNWSGSSQNTGPKGVVQDWQLYKQLESQQREENEKQRLELLKKLSITAGSTKDDDERKKNEEIEAELAELLDEKILQQFQKQRISEMLQMCGQQNIFGKVVSLTSGDDFLNAIEKDSTNTVVVVHIYEKNIAACRTMNSCLEALATDYKNVKFCNLISSTAGLSLKFKSKGLPALLVYKGNKMIGNFVRITDELSDDFFPSDLESFLIEHGVITDKSNLLSFS